MYQDQKNIDPQHENEVDMGIFYKLISRFFKKIGSFFASIFRFFSNFTLNFSLLIKRNLVWLFASAALGFGYGLYLYNTSDPTYFSEMIVKTNFESSRLLYQKINHYNSLINEGQTKELSKIFGISELEASKLGSFSIEPVNDPLQVSKLYKTNFLNYNRNSSLISDTSWTRTMSFKDFVKNLTDYDYPLHRIKLNSLSSTIYPKIQEGIVREIQGNGYLQKAREVSGQIRDQEEVILTSALKGLDSLRQAYNVRIRRSADVPSSDGDRIIMAQGSNRLPEIELYDKELALKDELMRVKQRGLDQEDIIQVYADFSSTGDRANAFEDRPYVRLTLMAILIAFVIIVMRIFYNYLALLEKEAKKKSAPPVN